MTFEPLDDESVVSVPNANSHMPFTTFKLKDWQAALTNKAGIHIDTIDPGMYCQVLVPGQPWRRGKIKISFEFEPEPLPQQPDESVYLTSTNIPSSPDVAEQTWPPPSV